MEIYNKNALHFPRLLTQPDSYIEYCNNKSAETGAPWDLWLSGGDDAPHPYGELWTIYDQDEEQKALLDNYDNAVLYALEMFLAHLSVPNSNIKSILSNKKNTRPRALSLKRYYEGEELGPHPDADPNGDPEKLPLTVSMYFNDDYVGGQLGFEDGSKIDLTVGSVVVFPAIYLHESTKVTSGVKYVSNEVIVLNKSDLGVEVL